jgi:polar amino acid transport system permease protein
VASLQYLWVTSVLMVGQYYLERHFARGSVRQLPLTPWQRLNRGLVIRPGRASYGGFVTNPQGAPVVKGTDD